MEIPEDLRYTTDHEWVMSQNGNARIGITDFAQEALGDVVYVALPAVGTTVERGGVLGEVESTKSVSEVYAPVAGEVVEVNDTLLSSPERLNAEPYGNGWICVLRPTSEAEFSELLDAAGYRALVAE